MRARAAQVSSVKRGIAQQHYTKEMAYLQLSCSFALGVAFILGGCGDAAASKADAGKPIAATLQLNWVAEPEFGGFYAARDGGFFKDAGLDVTVTQGGASIPTPQLVASGAVDFALVSASQILEIAAAGGDLVALFTVFQDNPRGVMVHESAPWKTLEELWRSDATIAIEEGLAEYVWVQSKYSGGKLKCVPYTGSFAQFVADPRMANQCYVTAEPVQLALQQPPVPVRVFNLNEAGFNPYECVVVTRRSFFDEHRTRCEAFVHACQQGWNAYLKDPTAAHATMHTLNPAMSLDAMLGAFKVQQDLVESDDTKRLGIGAMTEARWQQTIDQLFEIKRIPSKPVAASIYHWNSSGN